GSKRRPDRPNTRSGGVPGESQPGHKGFLVDGREPRGDPRVAGIEYAGGRVRVDLRLHSGDESIEAVFNFADRSNHFPTQAIVERKAPAHAIFILKIKSRIPGS